MVTTHASTVVHRPLVFPVVAPMLRARMHTVLRWACNQVRHENPATAAAAATQARPAPRALPTHLHARAVATTAPTHISGDEEYDVVVVGAGHAGCEAALAAARLGCKTLLLTLNLDRIAWQVCLVAYKTCWRVRHKLHALCI